MRPGGRACGLHSSSVLLLLLLAHCSAAALGPAPSPPRRQPPSNSSRFAVAFEPAQRESVLEQLATRGYSILSEGRGFLVVAAHPRASAPRAAAALLAAALPAAARRKLSQQRRLREQGRQLAALQGIAGVHSSELDVRRFLHARPSSSSSSSRRLAEAAGAEAPARVDAGRRRLGGHWHSGGAVKPGPYDTWGGDVTEQRCAARDMPLASGPGAEVVPWGIKEVGAWNKTLQDLPAKGRAIVCIIDSGLWAQHPEYAAATRSSSASASGGGDRIDGCAPGPDCPFTWREDLVGHGTHVAGTVGAPANGLGIVGVISRGAEVHVVRIWNDSGDVSQGQGPYATDLVLAYDNCLDHLNAQQAKSGGRRVNMVINMSYGSAGPLTVERLWIQRAAARGDVLFAASAGNNGSMLEPRDPGRGSGADVMGQYLSYPASYNLPEVLSVANMRCDGTVDFTSQKNRQVSIAAPGMAVLSSVPNEFGAMRAHITSSPALPSQPGAGTARLGYRADGFREPRPIRGTALGSSGLRPLAVCNITADVRAVAYGGRSQQEQRAAAAAADAKCVGAEDAVCLVELPGSIELYHETCIAMTKCVRSGGKGLIVWRDDAMLASLFTPDPGWDVASGGDSDSEPQLLGTQVNCGTKCACWDGLSQLLGCKDYACSGRVPPGVVVSAKHASALVDAAAVQLSVVGDGDGSQRLLVDISNYEYPYRYYDGTSMAAPHVSGAAALLWRLFPACKARDISDGLKGSARPLPRQAGIPADGPDLAAGSGMLRVDAAYEWMLKNKACARA